MKLYNLQVDVPVGAVIQGSSLFVTYVFFCGRRRMIIEYQGGRMYNGKEDVHQAQYGAKGWKQGYMISIYGVDVIITATVQGNCARYTNHHFTTNVDHCSITTHNSRRCVEFIFSKECISVEVFFNYRRYARAIDIIKKSWCTQEQ